LDEITDQHILRQETIPENVQVILKNACLDCHSNQTNYLWYDKISPASWFVYKHIVNAKEDLNFSDWGQMDAYAKMDALDEMCEEVEKGNMPLKSYTALHAKAKLSDEEKKLLCDWSEKLIEKFMKQSVN
jgi:hypothetical protein